MQYRQLLSQLNRVWDFFIYTVMAFPFNAAVSDAVYLLNDALSSSEAIHNRPVKVDTSGETQEFLSALPQSSHCWCQAISKHFSKLNDNRPSKSTFSSEMF
jgi:hypothetical protein